MDPNFQTKDLTQIVTSKHLSAAKFRTLNNTQLSVLRGIYDVTALPHKRRLFIEKL